MKFGFLTVQRYGQDPNFNLYHHLTDDLANKNSPAYCEADFNWKCESSNTGKLWVFTSIFNTGRFRFFYKKRLVDPFMKLPSLLCAINFFRSFYKCFCNIKTIPSTPPLIVCICSRVSSVLVIALMFVRGIEGLLPPMNTPSLSTMDEVMTSSKRYCDYSHRVCLVIETPLFAGLSMSYFPDIAIWSIVCLWLIQKL